MTEGTLYGLGVGPGDPELITLKALRLLQAAPVLAYPAPDDGASLARAIAAPHIPNGRIEIVVRTPMTPGHFPANDVYDRYAAEIAGHLTAGRDVAHLCEGDPFLYGSFMYLYERLAPRHRVVVVPGVSSLGACAAAAGAPLVSRNQVLAVLPATLAEETLAVRLRDADAVAVMKVGRHLPKVRRALAQAGRMAGAILIERATFGDQRVRALAEVSDESAPYFSMVLVRRPNGEDM